MNYVIGIDLGTSSVKTILVNETGETCAEATKSYPIYHQQAGWSEQNPDDWVDSTLEALKDMLLELNISSDQIKGLSYSGQMHGLVLLDENSQVLRNAILWNDTRNTKQCEELTRDFGEEILNITKNKVLEGFTLPKIRWVQQNESFIFEKAALFLMPKDYVRFKMTGLLSTDYSDAAGTLLFDVSKKEWSHTICKKFNIPISLCPPLVASTDQSSTLSPEIADKLGIKSFIPVFAGGADNACGAIGAGVLSKGKTMCSIGTSGVILSHEHDTLKDFKGKVHFFNHGEKDSFYSMGVTLSAGYSLQWFKETFAKEESFDEILRGVNDIPLGASGLLFTPYLVGERTPYSDSTIRASFIGMDGSHKREHFVRAIMEGITFSLLESIQLFRNQGQEIKTVVSIGGGAKSDTWLQMQADIFNTNVITIRNEQGPALGAAIIAAVGSGMFNSLDSCTKTFIKEGKHFTPIKQNVEIYKGLFKIYQSVYKQTKFLNEQLTIYRR